MGEVVSQLLAFQPEYKWGSRTMAPLDESAFEIFAVGEKRQESGLASPYFD